MVWTWVQPVQCKCYGSSLLLPSRPTDDPRRNTQIEDTCIVFRQWHISSRFVFALSFIAIIFISLGYEYLRAYQRSVDRRIALVLSRGKGRYKGVVSGRSSPELSGADIEDAGLLSGRRKKLSNWYALTPPCRNTLDVTVPMISLAHPSRSTPGFYVLCSTVPRSSCRSF